MKYLLLFLAFSACAKEPTTTQSKPKIPDVIEIKGCMSCHSTNIAPPFKGLFGSKRELKDGSFVTANRAYIFESILYPQKKVVKGYNPIMPPYNGYITGKELDEIADYLESIK